MGDPSRSTSDDPATARQDMAALAALIVRSATDFAIVTCDAAGVITSWSPGAHAVMGWTEMEAVGRHVGLFFTLEDVANRQPELEMSRAGAEGCATDERWHMKRDGTRFWASGELQPLLQDGETVGFVKILRDRTEHVRMLDDLIAARQQAAIANERQAEEGLRLREMFAGAPGFIAVLRGPEHVFDYVNASYERLVGPRTFIGRSVREVLPEVEGQGFYELLDQVYTTGERVTAADLPIMLRSAVDDSLEQHFVNFVYEPMRDPSGVVVGIFVEGFDSTDAALARMAAGKAFAEQSTILSQLSEGVIATDAAGRITFVNAAAERLHGVARLDVGPDDYSETYRLLTEGGAPYPSNELPLARAVMHGDVVRDARWRIRRPDGSEVFAVGNAQPVMLDGRQVGAVLTVRDDTERERADAAARETAERYRIATAATTDAVWDWDLRSNQVVWNESVYTAFGYGADEVGPDGDWWIGCIHPDDRARVDASIHLVIDGDVANWSDEYRFLRADGSYADIFDRGAVIRDESGRATRMIGAMLDLTERKAAEAALRAETAALATAQDAQRASEVQYRTLFDAIDAGFCIIEVKFGEGGGATDYRFVEVNPAFARQTGLADAEGRSVREMAPDFEQRWIDVYGRVAVTREPVRYEDNSEALGRWFEVYAFAVEPPETRRVAVLFNDVTERKRAEIALTELNRTLERRVAETVAERDMIWRTSRDLFVVGGLDGLYRSANPAWREALGHDPDALVGLRFDSLVHPDDLEPVAAAFAGVVTGEIVRGIDLRMRHDDGSYRWFSWTCVPQNDIFYATGRDVTERKELEEQLRQSQKMEAVGQLTGGIAHDFNNLLTIVSGNIDMARRTLGPEGNARALRSLGNAAKGADRAAALTQRLLAFSRRQPLQPRETDVNRLITGMTELLDRALGETVDLQVVTGAGLWRVEVDPNQLENAILNLAVNARDAMPGGGNLTIETNNTAIDEAYAAAQREVVPGQYVLVSVTDTGEGMPPDVAAKAFDPFFSTKDVGKGTGLGLSQVYGYVKQSGGHVKIYSESGLGTTIKIYLPRLVAAMNGAEDEAVADAAPAMPGMESILVVEDDDDVRIYTVDTLRELGYRVLEAHDGASALRLLERQEEAPALLLTDVVMPGMSGRELADKARTTWPDMRVLFTTGYARNAIVHGGRLDRGVELLPKPFTYEALAAKVREVLEKTGNGRALILDPSESARRMTMSALATLGLEAEPAADVREALGKLRAAAGRFDVILLSDAVPVDNLDAVLAELHAVRSDLPILIVSAEEGDRLSTRHADQPCIAVIATKALASDLELHLIQLRVKCANAF